MSDSDKDKKTPETVELQELDIPLGYFDFNENRRADTPTEKLHQLSSAIVNETTRRGLINTDTIEYNEIELVGRILSSSYELKRIEEESGNNFSKSDIETAAINAISAHSTHNNIDPIEPPGKGSDPIVITQEEIRDIVLEAEIRVFFHNNPKAHDEYIRSNAATTPNIVSESSEEPIHPEENGVNTNMLTAISMLFGVSKDVVRPFLEDTVKQAKEGNQPPPSSGNELETPGQGYFDNMLSKLVNYLHSNDAEMGAISSEQIKKLEAEMAKARMSAGEKYDVDEVRTAAINALSKDAIEQYKKDMTR